MKKIMIFIFFLSANAGFTQETEFKFTKDGFTDFVVVQCENKTQAELYKKTLDWIAVNYNTPSAVIKGQIENDYIRIEGSVKDLITSSSKYQIEISFKDGKYKFDVIEFLYWSEFPEPKYKEFNMSDTKKHYNKQGQIKHSFKLESERLPKYFNTLNSSLKDFLLSEQIPSKKKEW